MDEVRTFSTISKLFEYCRENYRPHQLMPEVYSQDGWETYHYRIKLKKTGEVIGESVQEFRQQDQLEKEIERARKVWE